MKPAIVTLLRLATTTTTSSGMKQFNPSLCPFFERSICFHHHHHRSYSSGGYTSPHSQPIAVRISGGVSTRDGGLGFPPTYNELPTPQGDWQQHYKRQNSKANRTLAVGVTMFVGTIYAINQIVDFNASVPELIDPVDEMCKEMVVVVEEEPKKC